MKLNEWLSIWLTKYEKNVIKSKTYYVYERIINKHINPIIGGYELKRLTHNQIQEFINEKSEHGNLRTNNALAPNTIHLICSILHQALDLAHTLKMINSDLFSLVYLPRIKQKEITAFTLEEQKCLEDYCLTSNKPNYFGIVLCLYTGIRIGELLALSWEDIDFDNHLLYIRHTLSIYAKDNHIERCLEEPKTNNSKRIIPLSSTLINHLKRIRKQNSSQFIITTRNNNVVDIRSYQRTFERILIKCQIKYKNFHCLRHTFATRALELGVDIKTLSELLGHSNASITLNRYAHSMMNYKIQVMNKISSLLK